MDSFNRRLTRDFFRWFFGLFTDKIVAGIEKITNKNKKKKT